MAAKIHCFFSDENSFPEIIKFSENNNKIIAHHPKNEKEMLSKLPPNIEPHILLFDPKTLSHYSKETIEFLNSEHNYILALVSLEEENDSNIKFLHISPSIGHLIPIKNKTLESEMKKLLMIVDAADAAQGLEMTIEKVLNNLVNKKSYLLSESQERWACYDGITEYLENLSVFPDFSNIIKMAASELLTNAFYDAPKNPETGKSLNPSRKSKIHLVPPKKVEFTLGMSEDNQYLWMFVRDPFGTLDKSTLVAALLRAAIERTAKLDQEGGAGLGLKIVYERASELVFGLNIGESTLVGCKFKLTKRNLIFDAELASLHICIRP
ncbi:MAG: hypothetical protein H6625_02495 [Bdellovibrionaceae bacterium]|nr:hypothetical protein [Pseudobdellovibrionaceae bacterium]